MTMISDSPLPVIALIATTPRVELLQNRALPSIQRQSHPPEAVVVVADQRRLTAEETEASVAAVPMLPSYLLANVLTRGVAGAWNTGLKFIARRWPACYVAILDDDDEWDSDHIETCFGTAHQAGWPDVVVSGLRILRDGEEIPRPPPARLHVDDFLVGNPGWQGSNTFVSIQTLLKAGMFTEGLASTNDRDLAIRILSQPRSRIAFTGKHTTTWNIDSHRTSLSSPGSAEKSRGLASFLRLHGHRMTPEIRDRFYMRAQQLFGLTAEDILKAQEALAV